jgi:DNA polymerase
MAEKNKISKLRQLKKAILRDKKCSKLALEATNLVMGDGNVNAKFFLIGEAPGKKEDESGLPFVGAAGKFLNEMLLSAGINREEVYITNIVKYRPPKNRDPSTKEKSYFLPYLIEELMIVNPEVVITLGRHSMEYFFASEKISEVHGRKMKVEIIGWKGVLIPLYHPAAALYNGSLRQTLKEDFLRLTQMNNEEST